MRKPTFCICDYTDADQIRGNPEADQRLCFRFIDSTIPLVSNNNKKFRSFKSKENIHKKEVGPYRGFGYSSFISDPINLAKKAGG